MPEKIKGFFPEINSKQRILLKANFIADLLVGLVLPSMHALMNATLAQDLGRSYSKLLSLETLLFCASSMIYCSLWKKVQKSLMTKYFKFEIFETIVLSSACIFFCFKFYTIPYYIFDIGYGILVGQLASRIAMSFKNFLFADPQEKIDANNANDFYSNIGCLIGYGLALLDPISYIAGGAIFDNDPVTKEVIINYLYLHICLITFCAADILRTFASVYTYCFKWKITIWKEFFRSRDKKKKEKKAA